MSAQATSDVSLCVAAHRAPRMPGRNLTARERGIVRVLASGATNREIAARLGVCEQTVKNRLTGIYDKLGVRNRLELAVHLGRMAAPDTARTRF